MLTRFVSFPPPHSAFSYFLSEGDRLLAPRGVGDVDVGGGFPTSTPFGTLEAFGQRANLISGQVEGSGPGNKAVLCPTLFCCNRTFLPASLKTHFLWLTLRQMPSCAISRAHFLMYPPRLLLAICPTRTGIIGKKFPVAFTSKLKETKTRTWAA